MPRAQSPFDPFDHASIDDDVKPAAMTSGPASIASKTSTGTNKSSSKALPPRLVIRLSLHEEVSSTVVVDPDDEGCSLSQLSIEGKIVVHVESSNALKSTPFWLEISGPMVSLANFTCFNHCVLEDEDATANGNIETVRCKVDLPKSISTACKIMTYNMNVRTQNMPILVQAMAAMVKSNTCRISVQVRSNLSNEGDLTNFAIIVAIPPTTLRGDTLKVTHGDHGVWDSNKRIVSWKIGNLPHGESCLVSAEAEVSDSISKLLHDNPFSPIVAEGKIHCPVLVRCLSDMDQVSDLALKVKPIKAIPATIVEHQTRSYQLLHRVGSSGV